MSGITKRTAIRLSAGLILIAVLIYFSEPKAILSAILSANPYYIMLSLPLYPIAMILYTFRWQIIVVMMGDKFPLWEAHQAVLAGAFVSDFTPARLGDFLKPLMVKDRIDVGKGMASVIIDHWADTMTSVILGIIGLLAVLHMRNWQLVLLILAPLSGMLVFLSSVLLRKDLVVRVVQRINRKRITNMVMDFYNAMDHVDDKLRLIEASILLTCIIWITLAFRFAILIKAFGYDAPVVKLFFLLPLVNMLSSLPLTISGLGIIEGGMTLLVVALGEPPSVGLSIALLDRALSMGYHALMGSRYASRLL
ncbi:MAG: lysylphosphatidylglycerol synthase transmembrane domain-containing protein [Methanotrichaceae archaeon]